MAGRQEKPWTVITREVALEKYKEYLTMNWKNEANCNPKVTKHLKATHPGTFQFVEIGALDADGIEAAIAATDETNPDRVPFHANKSETTGTISLTRLVTKHPALRTPRGRIRRFPLQFRTENGVSFLAINLKESFTEPSPVNKKGEKKSKEEQKPGNDASGEVAAADETKK